jgi:raffinose/stachyose/melibiose transport system substrate-binding protein
MSMKRHVRVALATTVAGLLMLTACGGAEEASDAEGTGSETEGEVAADDREDVTITVWSWRTEDEDAYNRIFEVYEDQNPHVTVEFIPYVNTDYNNVLATGLTGSGGPDVAQLRAYGGLQPLVEAGQLVPLDGEIGSLNGFSDELLDGARGVEDGRVYGAPFGIQTIVAFYNRGIFDEHGLSEPETWDEFIEVLETLDAADVTPIANGGGDDWMLPIVHEGVGAARYGANEFREAVLAGETDFTDPDYVASIQVIEELLPYFPDQAIGVSYNDSRSLFAAERAALFIGGSFEVGFWESDAPDVEVGAFRIPAAPGSPSDAVTPGWVDGSYGVNASSENQEEAIRLVDWMGSEEFGQLFVDEIQQLSAVPGLTPQNELLAQIADLYEESPSAYLLLTDFRYGDPWGTEMMGQGVQEIMLGDSSAEDVAANLQRGIEQWFTPSS